MEIVGVVQHDEPRRIIVDARQVEPLPRRSPVRMEHVSFTPAQSRVVGRPRAVHSRQPPIIERTFV
jgi:hypothetical protein